MQSTGVIRKTDELGRLSIPMELRKTFKLNKGDSIGFYAEGDYLVLEKDKPFALTRRMDDLGRLVLPREYVKNYEDRAPFEIFTEENKIFLKYHRTGCIFCGEIYRLEKYKDKPICLNCMEDMLNNFIK